MRSRYVRKDYTTLHCFMLQVPVHSNHTTLGYITFLYAALPYITLRHMSYITQPTSHTLHYITPWYITCDLVVLAGCRHVMVSSSHPVSQKPSALRSPNGCHGFISVPQCTDDVSHPGFVKANYDTCLTIWLPWMPEQKEHQSRRKKVNREKSVESIWNPSQKGPIWSSRWSKLHLMCRKVDLLKMPCTVVFGLPGLAIWRRLMTSSNKTWPAQLPGFWVSGWQWYWLMMVCGNECWRFDGWLTAMIHLKIKMFSWDHIKALRHWIWTGSFHWKHMESWLLLPLLNPSISTASLPPRFDIAGNSVTWQWHT